MDDQVTLIVFAGQGGGSPTERLVAGAQHAAARDLIELGLEEPLVGHVFLATDAPLLQEAFNHDPRVTVITDPPGEPFHFGGRLRAIVDQPEVRFPLYFSGAAAPLIEASTLREVCVRLLGGSSTVIANNLWSADWFGIVPGSALHRIALPEAHDNAVPSLLARQAGLTPQIIDPAIGTIFDLDTPADLTILALHRGQRKHVKEFLNGANLPRERFGATMPFLISQKAHLSLIGRVNTSIWGKAMTDIPGAKRLFVEERGMVAFGRDTAGEVRSLIGHLYQQVGPRQFFRIIGDLADAVFFDSRVLFQHLGLNLTPADRFASDLGDVDTIANEVARDFTRAAIEAHVPVILGGHGVVAGSLWALTQEAWERADDGTLPDLPERPTVN